MVVGATCATEGTVNTVGALSESVTIVSFAVDSRKTDGASGARVRGETAGGALQARKRHRSRKREGYLLGGTIQRGRDGGRLIEQAVPVLAVNVAEVALAATLTEGGTVKADGALLERVTTVLAAADFDRVTVQVVLALEARLDAAHCREEIVLQGRERDRG